MKIETLPIDNFSHDPENARLHDERNMEAIKNSLTQFGQQKPIVVDKDNFVVAGNGTLAAAEELGWTEIACVRTGLEKDEARAYAIADNRTAELAEWDFPNLGLQLDGLDGAALVATGFDENEVGRILDNLSSAEVSDEGEWDGMPSFDQEEEQYQRIVVKISPGADVESLSRALGSAITEKTKSVHWPPRERNKESYG